MTEIRLFGGVAIRAGNQQFRMRNEVSYSLIKGNYA
jgi:hypothetical protein